MVGVVIIARRKIDARPIIGAVFVFIVIGLIIFGAYYFLIAQPAAEALKASRNSAISQINSSLAGIGTNQAASAITTYTSQVQAAGSETDINSILANVTVTALLEQEREEVLAYIDTATDGTYYSTTSASDKTQVQALIDLSQTLKTTANAKQTKSELETYKTDIDTQATSTWQTLLTGVVNQIQDNENRVAMTRNSPPYGEFMGNENALTYISGQNWQTLSKLKFEEATVQVSVSDTFQRTPTIVTGSTVKVYVYDTVIDNMRLMFSNGVVRNVIYSQSDIGTIAWTPPSGETAYSIDMWETIKAAAADNTEAAAIAWQNYGSDLMSNALSAQIGSYTVSVIYVVEVSDTIGEEIAQYEFHESATKDIILIPSV